MNDGASESECFNIIYTVIQIYSLEAILLYPLLSFSVLLLLNAMDCTLLLQCNYKNSTNFHT